MLREYLALKFYIYYKTSDHQADLAKTTSTKQRSLKKAKQSLDKVKQPRQGRKTTAKQRSLCIVKEPLHGKRASRQKKIFFFDFWRKI